MANEGRRRESEREREREREEIEMEMCRLASRWLRRLLVYSSGSAITSRPALCSSSLCCSSKNRSKLGLIQPSFDIEGRGGIVSC